MKKELQRFDRKAVLRRPENRIDKLRKYLLQDDINMLPHDVRIVLTSEDQRMLRILEEAFSLLIGNSESEARKILKNKYKVTSEQARNYIVHSKQLFGLVESFDKVSARFIQIERFEAIIREITNDKTIEKSETKYDLIIKCQAEINKLKKLYDDDVIDPKELAKQLVIPEPVFTTDPRALEQAAEDAEVVE